MQNSCLVVELGLVLPLDVVLAQVVHGALLLRLQFVRLLVVPHQHRVRRLQLRLPLVQLLKLLLSDFVIIMRFLSHK